ncbi:MAG TPA: non-homologous end-joining DNA ligase [Acidobacteriota bacterium]|nr:non-homologous end-joining DNA ligase [Acidobacteriota bacterium]
MLAQLREKLPSGPDYVYEIKLDGQRTLVEASSKKLLLYTRTHQNVTEKYPEFAEFHQQLKCRSAVIDGEIVALREGIPSFELLQQRMNVRDRRMLRAAVEGVPVIYYAFDLLEVDGKSLMNLPLLERRQKLQKVLKPSGSVKILPFFESSEQILEKAQEFGYEGLMIKRRKSLYRPGQRGDDWIKYKFLKYDTFLICGWTEGGRVRDFGALVMGKYHGRGKYAHIGQTGTGFTDRVIHMLMARFEGLEIPRCPFVENPGIAGKVHWLKPVLKAEIKFKEWTNAEILRSPVFVRLVR